MSFDLCASSPFFAVKMVVEGNSGGGPVEVLFFCVEMVFNSFVIFQFICYFSLQKDEQALCLRHKSFFLSWKLIFVLSYRAMHRNLLDGTRKGLPRSIFPLMLMLRKER